MGPSCDANLADDLLLPNLDTFRRASIVCSICLLEMDGHYFRVPYVASCYGRRQDAIRHLRKHPRYLRLQRAQRVLKCQGNLDDLICQEEIVSMTTMTGSVMPLSCTFSTNIFPAISCPGSMRSTVPQPMSKAHFFDVSNKCYQKSLDAAPLESSSKWGARYRIYNKRASISVRNEGGRVDGIRRVEPFVDMMS